MKILLKSPYPCLIKTPDESIEIDENDTCEILNEKFCDVYALSSRQISFRIDLKNLASNSFFSVMKANDSTIILLKPQSSLRVTKKEKLNFGGKTCDVQVCDKSITFDTSDRKVEYKVDETVKNPKIFKQKDFACVQFDGHLFAYSIKNNKLSHFSGEIDLNGDHLNLTKKLHDSDCRVRKCKFLLDEDITLENEEFERTDGKLNIDLIPFKFMESVKAKDFSRSLEFLSKSLQNELDESKICDFFGNFSSFLALSTTEFITLSPNCNNFVKFSMDEDKVCDINVDGL